METKTKSNGQAPKADATKPKDTENGAAASVSLQKFQPSDPIAERLKKIHDVHTLSTKRSRLIETQDDLRNFENELGENDSIMLINHGGNKVTVKRPEAVKKVLDLLKGDVDYAITVTNNELLTAAL